MNKYKKITKEDVLELMMDIDIDVTSYTNIISIPCMSNFLKTSKYQVRKYIKELKNDGLVVKDYYYASPEYPSLCGFKITDKVKKLDTYKDKEQLERNLIKKIWGF